MVTGLCKVEHSLLKRTGRIEQSGRISPNRGPQSKPHSFFSSSLVLPSSFKPKVEVFLIRSPMISNRPHLLTEEPQYSRPSMSKWIKYKLQFYDCWQGFGIGHHSHPSPCWKPPGWQVLVAVMDYY